MESIEIKCTFQIAAVLIFKISSGFCVSNCMSLGTIFYEVVGVPITWFSKRVVSTRFRGPKRENHYLDMCLEQQRLLVTTLFDLSIHTFNTKYNISFTKLQFFCHVLFTLTSQSFCVPDPKSWTLQFIINDSNDDNIHWMLEEVETCKIKDAFESTPLWTGSSLL